MTMLYCRALDEIFAVLQRYTLIDGLDLELDHIAWNDDDAGSGDALGGLILEAPFNVLVERTLDAGLLLLSCGVVGSGLCELLLKSGWFLVIQRGAVGWRLVWVTGRCHCAVVGQWSSEVIVKVTVRLRINKW